MKNLKLLFLGISFLICFNGIAQSQQNFNMKHPIDSTIWIQFVKKDVDDLSIGLFKISELQTNLQENFILIEDWYKGLFLRYDIRYQYYENVHPNQGVSKDKWIKEHNEKLKELRMTYFSRFYKRYKSYRVTAPKS